MLQVCIGGKVPAEYYKGPEDMDIDLSKFTSVVVDPGDTHQVEVEVNKANSVLRLVKIAGTFVSSIWLIPISTSKMLVWIS